MKFTDTNSVQYEVTFHFWEFLRKMVTEEDWHLFEHLNEQVFEQVDEQVYWLINVQIKVHLRKHSHGNKK